MLKQLKTSIKSRFSISKLVLLFLASVSILAISYGFKSSTYAQKNTSCFNCERIVEFIDCEGLERVLEDPDSENLDVAHNINICKNVREKCNSD